MKLTGLIIRDYEMSKDLEKTIKEFEIERTEKDLLNRTKLDPLYKIYYRLLFHFKLEGNYGENQ